MAGDQRTAILDHDAQDPVGPWSNRADAWGRVLFDQCLNGIVIVRLPDGMILDANRSACHDLGYTRDELLQVAWPVIVSPPREVVRVLTSGAMDEQSDAAEIKSFQTSLTTKQGEGRTVRLRYRTLTVAGTPCGMLIWQDITETTRTSKRLRQQEDELAHMGRVGLMGELVTVLAHEVNQPVCAIISNAQAARRIQNMEGRTTTAITEILADIVSDARRAADVLANLRAMLQKKNQARRPENINEVIRNIEGYVRKDAERFGVHVSFDLDEELPRLLINRIEIQQVILNLLRNAFEVTGKTGVADNVVTLSARKEDRNWIRVDVMDRGLGVPEWLMDQLFSPFFSTKRDGLGMGLAISKSIIESHAGQIHAHANPDRGMSFGFSLPVYRPATQRGLRSQPKRDT